METAPACLASSYAAVGRSADRELLARRFDSFLAEARSQGIRYWGISYQRAAMAALAGDPTSAMASLEEASTLGWRRAWWARTDPALTSLRSDQQFDLLLQRIAAQAGSR
jgi:hypothetical protein